MTKQLRLLSESDWAIFESWRQLVELFVQKQNFWDHRLEAICTVVLACLWATEVSEILVQLHIFDFLKDFWDKKSWIISLMEVKNLWEIHTSSLERNPLLFLCLILKISVPVCSEVLSVISSDLWALRVCYKELRAEYPLCVPF